MNIRFKLYTSKNCPGCKVVKRHFDKAIVKIGLKAYKFETVVLDENYKGPIKGVPELHLNDELMIDGVPAYDRFLVMFDIKLQNFFRREARKN